MNPNAKSIAANRVCIIASLAMGMCSTLLGCSPPSGSTAASSTAETQSERIAGLQVQAKAAMNNLLKDPQSAKYKDVEAYLVAGVPNVPDAYAFCGRVNAKNSFGGYMGFQHFIAGPGVATTEDRTKDFADAWTRLCAGAGTPVAF